MPKHNPDYTKNKDADVIKKGSSSPIPQEHYESNHDLTPAGSDDGHGAFLPRKARDRSTPHKKTNECDH